MTDEQIHDNPTQFSDDTLIAISKTCVSLIQLFGTELKENFSQEDFNKNPTDIISTIFVAMIIDVLHSIAIANSAEPEIHDVICQLITFKISNGLVNNLNHTNINKNKKELH